MSTELQLIVLAIGLDSLVSLHLLVIGVVMALMRKQAKYWRMAGAGLALAVAPVVIYCGLDFRQSGSSTMLAGLLVALLVLVYSGVVMARGSLRLGGRASAADTADIDAG